MYMCIPSLHSARSLPVSVLRDPVLQKPTESERLNHRLIGPTTQHMYIMADLRKMDRYMYTVHLCNNGYLMMLLLSPLSFPSPLPPPPTAEMKLMNMFSAEYV